MAARDTCKTFETISQTGEASLCSASESEELSASLTHSGRHEPHKTDLNTGRSRAPSGLLFSLTAPLELRDPQSVEADLSAASPRPVQDFSRSSPTTISQVLASRCAIRLRNDAPVSPVEDPAMTTRQRDLPIYPEPEKNGLEEALLPISRKNNLRALARFQRGEPVMVRLDLIRAAYVNSGLTYNDIGELIGKSRYTVAAALRVDSSVNFYTFCEVMNVIGVEMAELFPVRRRKGRGLPERKPMTWSRGPHLRENVKRLVQEEETRELVNARPGRRQRK
jgi:hypothetical protein